MPKTGFVSNEIGTVDLGIETNLLMFQDYVKMTQNRAKSPEEGDTTTKSVTSSFLPGANVSDNNLALNTPYF